MRTLSIALVVIALGCSCGGSQILPAQPSGIMNSLPAPAPPVPPVPPSLPPGRVLTVGEAIDDTLRQHGEQRAYELTAPSDGTLTVNMRWEAARVGIALRIGDRWFSD